MKKKIREFGRKWSLEWTITDSPFKADVVTAIEVHYKLTTDS